MLDRHEAPDSRITVATGLTPDLQSLIPPEAILRRELGTGPMRR